MFAYVFAFSLLVLFLQEIGIASTLDIRVEDSQDANQRVIVISNEIHQWLSNPEPNLSNLPVNLKQFLDSLNTLRREGILSRSAALCEPCDLLASVVVYNARVLRSTDIVLKFLVILCSLLVYKSEEVCAGILSQDKDALDYIISNTNIDGATFCSLALGCGPFKGPSWTLDFPNPLKRLSEGNSSSLHGPQREKDLPLGQKPYKKVLKVLHLTDIHFDPYYKIGSNAVCEAPLCCNDDSGDVVQPSDAAGSWGDYRRCDSPKWLLDNMFQHIVATHPSFVNRYSHIIKAQFYGHSHTDEFRMHYDTNNPRIPVGVEYITPNNGPYENYNPSYRVFYIDGDHPHTTRNVLDYDTYVMNLTYANILNDPRWYKLYSARQDLQLPDMLPKSWDNLVKRFAKSPTTLFMKYHRYQVQDSDPALKRGCDQKCIRKTICSLVEGDSYLPRKCGRICKSQHVDEVLGCEMVIY